VFGNVKKTHINKGASSSCTDNPACEKEDAKNEGITTNTTAAGTKLLAATAPMVCGRKVMSKREEFTERLKVPSYPRIRHFLLALAAINREWGWRELAAGDLSEIVFGETKHVGDDNEKLIKPSRRALRLEKMCG
jgi:hypothetical protein